ncbi:MAG: DegQ family serine endoprotease [Sulfurimicrobium sp.]|nr:DegQ family serine endoprotease [Sulfurimicrobium sp.]MDP1705487.1 DegQ family serine endoprotease [Sulfurimicrobium sp.]MDP2198011.1 DegQ family serine endoprotease [Sulfurimicrobium sp.]
MRRIIAFVALFLSLTAFSHANALPDFTVLAEKHGASVVNISTTQAVRNESIFHQMPNLSEDDPMFDFFRRFMPPGKGQKGPRESQSRSLGSGFFISADGYILTNAHVVDAADEITVRLTDKREFPAKVIGSDRRTDVALIKIEAANLPKVTIGKPEQLRVGEWVAAIGSPFGFENSITAGIVSAKGRSLPQENYVPFIQTDVAINPGNSGGPLFNMSGEVVGINSQIFSRTGGYMGLSFAIPIDVAMDIGDQLRAGGKISRGWLGVMIQEVTRELAESFGLSKPMGALVANVDKGSPAEKAGLEASDVILKFDGKTVETSSELPRLVAAVKPGKRVAVQLWRKGAYKDVSLVVGELPDKMGRAVSSKSSKASNKLGLTLNELTEDQKRELKLSRGLLVEDAEGAAARAGVGRGDVILSVNNQDVKSLEHFNELVNQYGSGRVIALRILRGDRSLYIAIRINGK